MILIEHKDHGRMHVYSQADLEVHQAMGWTVVPEKPEKPNTLVSPRPFVKRRR